ncbi:MAG: hypothetical protein P8Y27_21200 [Chromatiaceae bacterium]
MSSMAHQFFYLPEQASTIAAQADAVLIGWIVLSVAVTLAIVGAMLFLGIRYRRGARVGGRSSTPTGCWRSTSYMSRWGARWS